VEERLRARGQRPADSSLEEMDALWDEAKQREGTGQDAQRGAGPRGAE
jgi:hypothetical protein